MKKLTSIEGEKLLSVSVSPAVLHKFPRLSISYVVADISKIRFDEKCDYVNPELILANLANKGVEQGALTKVKSVANWRNVYKDVFKIKKNKYVSAVEALMKRAISSKSMKTGIPVVDLYNACSVRNMLPLGAYDISKLDSSITLRFGGAGEKFYPLGGGIVDVEENHIVYADDNKVLTWLWNHKDSENCCIDNDTQQAIFFADSAYSDELIAVDTAINDLATVLEFFGCKILQRGLLNTDKPCSSVKIVSSAHGSEPSSPLPTGTFFNQDFDKKNDLDVKAVFNNSQP